MSFRPEQGSKLEWLLRPILRPFGLKMNAATQQAFPQLNTPLIDASGQVAIPWYKLFSWFFQQLQIIPQGSLFGLTLSNDATSPQTVLDVAIGSCRDSVNSVNMQLPTPWSKSTGPFAPGLGQGGLDTGVIAALSAYHTYLIAQPGGSQVDVLFSLSATAPLMPAGYTLQRRLGAFLTDASAHILAFSQLGDEFLLAASIFDVNVANPGTAATPRTLSVPTGIKVWALFNGGVANASNAVASGVLFSELDRNDEAPSLTTAPLESTPGAVDTNPGGIQVSLGRFSIRTNTLGQIRSRLIASDANCTLRIATFGWIDQRGRLY